MEQEAIRSSLQPILAARTVLVAGLALVAMLSYPSLAVYSLAPMAAVIVLLAFINVASAWRRGRAEPVTQAELGGHVLVDIVALIAFFAFAGGAPGASASLYVMPLAAAAATLPRARAVLLAVLALAAGLLASQAISDWLQVALCAGFVGCLVFRMANHARERQRKLGEALQKNLSDDYLLRTASLAAGAAHEIRSPLCTMAVLVNEMLQRPQDRETWTKNLRVLSDQVDACRRIVSELVSPGVDAPTIRAEGEAVDRFIHDLVEKWRTLRPGVALACRRQGTEPAPHIATDGGLRHAVLNLLNNAADASSRGIELVSMWTAAELRILVLDRGPGIAPEIADVLGKQLVSTKRDRGTGVGLLLAKTAIERAGGSLKLSNRPDGGACAEVVLPLGAAAGGEGRRPAVAALPLQVRYFHSGARRS